MFTLLEQLHQLSASTILFNFFFFWPTCANAQSAHMHNCLSVCPSVTSDQIKKFNQRTRQTYKLMFYDIGRWAHFNVRLHFFQTEVYHYLLHCMVQLVQESVSSSDARLRNRNRFQSDSTFGWNRNQKNEEALESESESENFGMGSESRIWEPCTSLLESESEILAWNWNRSRIRKFLLESNSESRLLIYSGIGIKRCLESCTTGLSLRTSNVSLWLLWCCMEQ